MSAGGVTLTRLVHREMTNRAQNAKLAATISAISMDLKPVAQRTVMSVPLAHLQLVGNYLEQQVGQIWIHLGQLRQLLDPSSCVPGVRHLGNSCRPI